jgi:hypothetical protein
MPLPLTPHAGLRRRIARADTVANQAWDGQPAIKIKKMIPKESRSTWRRGPRWVPAIRMNLRLGRFT